jgi:hypothetical protein
VVLSVPFCDIKCFQFIAVGCAFGVVGLCCVFEQCGVTLLQPQKGLEVDCIELQLKAVCKVQSTTSAAQNMKPAQERSSATAVGSLYKQQQMHHLHISQ